jgi:hypothetical protein
MQAARRPAQHTARAISAARHCRLGGEVHHRPGGTVHHRPGGTVHRSNPAAQFLGRKLKGFIDECCI